MRVISRGALKEFWEKHPDATDDLRAWFAEARDAAWSTPADVKARYGTASILKGGRVVFNIRGNRYRLVVKINYEFGMVFVRFVGTHTEYDGIDVETV